MLINNNKVEMRKQVNENVQFLQDMLKWQSRIHDILSRRKAYTSEQFFQDMMNDTFSCSFSEIDIQVLNLIHPSDGMSVDKMIAHPFLTLPVDFSMKLSYMADVLDCFYGSEGMDMLEIVCMLLYRNEVSRVDSTMIGDLYASSASYSLSGVWKIFPNRVREMYNLISSDFLSEEVLFMVRNRKYDDLRSYLRGLLQLGKDSELFTSIADYFNDPNHSAIAMECYDLADVSLLRSRMDSVFVSMRGFDKMMDDEAERLNLQDPSRQSLEQYLDEQGFEYNNEVFTDGDIERTVSRVVAEKLVDGLMDDPTPTPLHNMYSTDLGFSGSAVSSLIEAFAFVLKHSPDLRTVYIRSSGSSRIPSLISSGSSRMKVYYSGGYVTSQIGHCHLRNPPIFTSRTYREVICAEGDSRGHQSLLIDLSDRDNPWEWSGKMCRYECLGSVHSYKDIERNQISILRFGVWNCKVGSFVEQFDYSENCNSPYHNIDRINANFDALKSSVKINQDVIEDVMDLLHVQNILYEDRNPCASCSHGPVIDLDDSGLRERVKPCGIGWYCLDSSNCLIDKKIALCLAKSPPRDVFGCSECEQFQKTWNSSEDSIVFDFDTEECYDTQCYVCNARSQTEMLDAESKRKDRYFGIRECLGAAEIKMNHLVTLLEINRSTIRG